MTIQCCPLSPNGDDGPEFTSTKIRTARKLHQCCECKETILPRDAYEYSTGKWDGELSVFKTCLSCVEIRTHFACDGFIYEKLWEDLQDNFFPDMKAGGPCMEGLSPEARARLIDKRMKWLLD
jgi:hypothetical protein